VIVTAYWYVRAGFELLSFLATVGVLVVAYWALEQIRVAKTDLKTRVSREAAKESGEQLKIWATEITTALTECHVAEKKAGIQLRRCSMERFDLEELQTKSKEDRDHFETLNAAWDAHDELLILTLSAANLIEASAMTFITGVADETVAFASLSQVFCFSVESRYSLYCVDRRKDQQNRWDYTIKLYRKWSQRRNEFRLDAEHTAVSGALNQAIKDATPIRPLGA
jgi:hypothetical protein